jgi:hypothetical protein
LKVSVKTDEELEALMTLRESSRRSLGLRALNDNVIQYERKWLFYESMGLLDEVEAVAQLGAIVKEGMGLAVRRFSPLDRLLMSREEKEPER